MYVNGKNISFIDRSNSSVDMFLRNIKKSHPLSTSEEYDLWCKMRQGDERARTKLISSNLRYVVTIAKKFQTSGTPLEDLLMAGSLGITKAADLFDATLGFRFITFATWHIKNEVRKAAYDHINHHHKSLDEPLCSEESDSDTIISTLSSSMEISPDWHIRYDEALSSLKSCSNAQFWPGFSNLLEDYIFMREVGYSEHQFAEKHKLTKQQMKYFIDMVHHQVIKKS